MFSSNHSSLIAITLDSFVPRFVVALVKYLKSILIVITIRGNTVSMSSVCKIKKYSSNSHVGMGRVQNYGQYLRYRSDFAITKQSAKKHLYTSTLYYSNVQNDSRFSAIVSQGRESRP